MSNITNYLNKVKTAIYGKEVRGAIHDAIKQVYDDASVEHDNANMEVKLARGTHNTLNDRLDNVDEIQAQTNAQLSEVDIKLKGFININSFQRFVDSDGFWNEAFEQAQNQLGGDGGCIYFPSGIYKFKKITIKPGVFLRGDMPNHIFEYLDGKQHGTVLLFASENDDCVNFDISGYRFGMSDLSIYNTSPSCTNILNMTGAMYVKLDNIEVSSTVKSECCAILMKPYNENDVVRGCHYNYFFNLSVVGSNSKYGVIYEAIDNYEGANSNIWYGGRINAWYRNVVVKGIDAGTQQSVNNIVFDGVTIEHGFNPTTSPITHSKANMSFVGIYKDLYYVDFVLIESGKQNVFQNCRFEIGGVPSGYDDGVNGRLDLIGCINITNSEYTNLWRISGCSFFNAYVLNRGKNTIIDATGNGLSHKPTNQPVLMLSPNASKVLANNTVILKNKQTRNDAFLYDESTGKITIIQDGVYTISAQQVLTGMSENSYAQMIVKKNNQANSFIGDWLNPSVVNSQYRSVCKLMVNAPFFKGDTLEFTIYYSSSSGGEATMENWGGFINIVKL